MLDGTGRPQRGQGLSMPYEGNYETGFGARSGPVTGGRNRQSAPDDDPAFLALSSTTFGPV